LRRDIDLAALNNAERAVVSISLMKTSFCFGALLAIVGLAAAPLVSKAQTSSTSTSTTYVQTTKIIGSKVKTAQGEEIGQIKDVVLDRNTGCMAYTVLSTGGTGARMVG
jgi:uncharacterized protein YrrD